MIEPINGKHLNLIRGGAANAPRVQPKPAPRADAAADSFTDAATEGARLSDEIHQIVIDAYEYGLHHGEPQHYRRGWRYGVVCGLLPGALAGAALLALVLWQGGTL